jgi:hypothetical protein
LHRQHSCALSLCLLSDRDGFTISNPRGGRLQGCDWLDNGRKDGWHHVGRWHIFASNQTSPPYHSLPTPQRPVPNSPCYRSLALPPKSSPSRSSATVENIPCRQRNGVKCAHLPHTRSPAATTGSRKVGSDLAHK